VQRKIDALMHDYDGDVPGASVLVIRDVCPVVRRSYGLSNIEEHIAAAPSTTTGLALGHQAVHRGHSILLLAEGGRLPLDDPIPQVAFLLPEETAAVIDGVADHTGVSFDYEDVIPEADDRGGARRDVPAPISSRSNKTVFRRGERATATANSGYSLLSLIVEKASGQGFATF